MTDVADGFDPNILYCPPCRVENSLCERHRSGSVDTAIGVVETVFTARERNLQGRRAHSHGVWDRSVSLSGRAGEFTSPIMHFRESLAIVHDVGYAFPDSGMHALDGARLPS